MNYKEDGYDHVVDLTDNTNQGYQQRIPPSSPDSDSSSTSSIFSSDDKSSQSSPLSSPDKSERSWDDDQVSHSSKANSGAAQVPAIDITYLVHQVNTEPRPVASRQNPRRTHGDARYGANTIQKPYHPPQLTRQCDRAQNFVENLVDTTTQMLEVIWPKSITHCDKDYLGGSNLIGIRMFIQEVLKRSKTSYYTLQVALYYLVLIKPLVPKVDCADSLSHAQRTMQCGRRMFLAALILASKYLQDRNYSARAWSKISGLQVAEINSNEITFLTAVNWKLHIPEGQFQRWANIVYKYSTSQSIARLPSSSSYNCSTDKMIWRRIIPRLTPELDEVDIERFSTLSLIGNPCAPIRQPVAYTAAACRRTVESSVLVPASASLTTPAHSIYMSPPLSPKISALATPIMTPHMNGFCPTGARAWSVGQAMRETICTSQQAALRSYSSESWPGQKSIQQNRRIRQPLSRVISSASLISSPESMVSDVTQTTCSSRTSRSSSISSTMSAGARSGCFGIQVANHRSFLAGLNGACPGGPSVPSTVDCFVTPRPYEYNQYDSSDKMASDILMQLALASNTSQERASVDPSRKLIRNNHGQKRSRPLSIVENNLGEETRSAFLQAYADNTLLHNSYQAESFVLSQPNLVNELITGSTGSQLGSRKRQRGCPLQSINV